MNKYVRNNIIALSIFAVAMAFLESAVVIYMRKLFSPDNVLFPVKIISSNTIYVELFRELATIIMIACIAYIMGKNLMQRFSSFLYVFGVWDIFYYVWLKVFAAWPSSFFTWDLLFLIPVAWIGPVLAPIILSITMIALSLVIFNKRTSLTSREVSLLVSGSFIILYTFISDYAILMLKRLPVESFVPIHYNWPFFWGGEALLIFVIVQYWKRA